MILAKKLMGVVPPAPTGIVVVETGATPYTSYTFVNTLQQGDVVIAMNHAHDTNGWVPPSGYSSLFNVTVSTYARASFAYKVMGATPDTSITGLDNGAASTIIVLRGANIPLFDVAYRTTGGSSLSTPNPLSITPVTDGCLIIAMMSMEANTSSSSVGEPYGFTLIGSANASGGGGTYSLGASAYFLQSTAGTIDPGSFTGNSGSWVTVTMAIRPA